MKKLALISVCVLGLAFAGNAATKSSMTKQAPVKKEATVAKKNTKKAPMKKVTATTATPAKHVTPAKK